MIFGVVMMTLAILLTLYIVFSAVQCRITISNQKSFLRNDFNEVFASFMTKTTLLIGFTWFATIILNEVMVSQVIDFEPSSNISSSFFIIIVILSILCLISFRNLIYNRYLIDNVVRVIYVEYALSFVAGTLYAYIISQAIESALYIF